MKNTSSKVTRIAAATGIALAAFSLSVLAQSTWTPAPPNPPNCPSSTLGCNAPINVSSSAQSKAGRLALNTLNSPAAGAALDVIGNASVQGLVATGFALINGTQGAGKVLTSDANGVATWQTPVTPPGGGGGGGNTNDPVKGSVGGGCYAANTVNGFGSHTYGNATIPGAGNKWSAYTCSCPAGYSSQQISGQVTSGTGDAAYGHRADMCFHN